MPDEIKDFDTDATGLRGSRLSQDFKFRLGGETFELRHGLKVGSEVLNEWDPLLARMRTPLEERGEGYEPVDDEEFLEVWTRAMHGLLQPGQAATLERVLGDEVEPVMLPDLVEVILWAVRTVTGGRPTEASSASSTGSTTPSTEPDDSSSKDASSSPEADPSPV